MPESHVLGDVRTLLDYLGEQAGSRLQAHFEDTRPELGAPIRKTAVPPCRTYRHFVQRLTSILDGNRRRVQRPPRSKPEGDEGLNDAAFLNFSRDFLAAVAAPATVDTIRLTDAYVEVRRHSPGSRLWSALCRGWRHLRGQPVERLTKNATAAGAKRLAKRVVWMENTTFVLTTLTIVISAYAYTGHTILTKKQQILDDYQALSVKRATLIKENPEAVSLIGDDPLKPPRGCDPAYESDNGWEQASILHLVAAAIATESPDIAATHLALPQFCAIYWQYRKANQDIAGATLHLVSWTGIITNVPGLGTTFGDIFGVNKKLIEASARLHNEFCKYLHLRPEEALCVSGLVDVVYHSDEVAASVLACIEHYLLPALYGCLGAAAATFRMLRRKVDRSLVAMTDRGRIFQDVILGLLCGTIVGLFAGELGKSSPAQGLGLWALALLAGYNVTSMFAFLDDLSNRLFRPTRTHQQSPIQ